MSTISDSKWFSSNEYSSVPRARTLLHIAVDCQRSWCLTLAGIKKFPVKHISGTGIRWYHFLLILTENLPPVKVKISPDNKMWLVTKKWFSCSGRSSTVLLRSVFKNFFTFFYVAPLTGMPQKGSLNDLVTCWHITVDSGWFWLILSLWCPQKLVKNWYKLSMVDKNSRERVLTIMIWKECLLNFLPDYVVEEW